MIVDLNSQPYWTAADQAELDLLTYEFVKAVYKHCEGCSLCRGLGPWCPPLMDAFEGVLEWRAGRILRSKAAWLRERQTLVEEWAA